MNLFEREILLETSLVLIIAAVIALYIILKVFSLPVRILWKVFWNALIGWLALFLINSLSSWTDFSIPVTFWTALGVGVFGLPGLVALIIYLYFLR